MSIDILVADDEPHVTRALSFVFMKEGFSVETASNGQEAFAKLQTIQPRIAFLDLIMPKMTGAEVCRLIKADDRLRSIHVIILTCKGQELDRHDSLAAGADEFMTKPFSPREVVARVHTILHRAMP
jgi:DNA-binding response OmpR family regulator